MVCVTKGWAGFMGCSKGQKEKHISKGASLIHHVLLKSLHSDQTGHVLSASMLLPFLGLLTFVLDLQQRLTHL